MKLLLADDHTLFRDALLQYIERAEPAAKVEVAKDYYEVADILKKAHDYDLVLLDLRMPGMDGMDGFRKIRAEYPDTPVALMSGVAEPEDVNIAMDLGAAGYFPKTLSGKALLQAIQVVLGGERFVPWEHDSGRIMPSYYEDTNGHKPGNENQPASDAVQLTPREKEVLVYLSKGESNKEIARALDLQVVTVKLHVRGVCQKLNVKNRTQAALKARELGLVSGI